MQTIRVSCEGTSLVDRSALIPVQGSLKTLSHSSLTKLISSIKKFGFSFPFFTWSEDGAKHYLVDGHQRLKAIEELSKEYEIPLLPVCDIKASSLEEAKSKLLAASSQYGTMQASELIEFINETSLEDRDLSTILQFNDVDLRTLESEIPVIDLELEDPAEEPAAKEPKKPKEDEDPKGSKDYEVDEYMVMCVFESKEDADSFAEAQIANGINCKVV